MSNVVVLVRLSVSNLWECSNKCLEAKRNEEERKMVAYVR